MNLRWGFFVSRLCYSRRMRYAAALLLVLAACGKSEPTPAPAPPQRYCYVEKRVDGMFETICRDTQKACEEVRTATRGEVLGSCLVQAR